MDKKICLDGLWDFAPVYGVQHSVQIPKGVKFNNKIVVPSSWRGHLPKEKNQEFSAQSEYAPYRLFNYPTEWEYAETGVYRTEIRVPMEMKGQRIFLNFLALAQRSAVYLNGEQIAQGEDSFLPLRVEITEKVCWNEQMELIVVCTSFESVQTSAGVKSTGLVGSWFGNIVRGIWQSVYLECCPQISIEDIFITTSVRKSMLINELEINNNTGREESADIVLTVLDGENPVVRQSSSVRLLPMHTAKLTMQKDWQDPILWDCDNPHLYTMKAELYIQGKMVHTKAVRFGFREIWTQQDKIILNGKRINLRGDSWHFQGRIQQTKQYAENWYKMCKQYDVNCVRLHAQPHPTYYLDAADEMGMLIIDETAIYGSSKSMDAGNEVYIERCKKHITNLVKRDRNHPSVVIWSMQNEMRWVDGRDIFKLHIPSLMQCFKQLDTTRPIILEGDNRLISKDNTEIESRHYNIDGTIGQWDRKKPLIFGEHGGWWYICPQNSSMYIGLSAYKSFDDCCAGIAEKERLFIEYCRRHEVTGVSVFNFANYFARSMPNEDVFVGEYKIPKYSLTINNGMLKDYPIHIMNPANLPVAEAYRAVCVIPAEYDTNFYVGTPVERHFDVYNDTRKDVTARIEFDGAASATFEFFQKAGERREVALSLCTDTPGRTVLGFSLYHDGQLVYQGQKSYNFYQKERLDPSNKRVLYYGGDRAFDVLCQISVCKRLDSLEHLEGDVLVLGDYLDRDVRRYQNKLSEFAMHGGVIIVLEQDRLAFGKLNITKQGFFGVHSNDRHEILNGITDEDLRFWHPYTNEGMPMDIVKNAYVKPKSGDVNMILECSKGDFGDGGDLWTCLMEFGCKEGRVIFNQLELIENADRCPTAYKLLYNMLRYALGCSKRQEHKIMEIDLDCASADEIERAKDFDGNVLVFPTSDGKKLEQLLGCGVKMTEAYTYQLEKTTQSDVTYGISDVDLFGFDKVYLSPRNTVNYTLCDRSVEVQGAETLLQSVEGTPFEDYYVKGLASEYCKIALASLNKDKKKRPLPYLVRKGKFIVSQIKLNERTKRIYDRIRSNLGVFVDNEIFCEEECKRNDVVEFIMALPHQDYNDYEKEKAYYTDPHYSLNNLGEGLYGWMKKLEADDDGFITVPNSAGKIYFATCFVNSDAERKIKFKLEANCRVELYINGEPAKNMARFCKGINPVAFEISAGGQDAKFCLRWIDERPVRVQLTVDEVDPK